VEGQVFRRRVHDFERGLAGGFRGGAPVGGQREAEACSLNYTLILTFLSTTQHLFGVLGIE